jgi:hypothetical protein
MPKSPEAFDALRVVEALRPLGALRAFAAARVVVVVVVARRGDFFATPFLAPRLPFVFPFAADRLVAAGRFPAAALRREGFFDGFVLAIGGTPLPARR